LIKIMDILRFSEAPMKDESIEEYEHHEYEPITGTNLNNPGEIRINIETQDLFTLNNYITFTGMSKVTKADGSAYADTDSVSLTNNALMHLFSNIKYQLSGQEMESIFYPGQGTTMLGLLKYPDDFSKQSYLIKSPDPKGTFSFRIPLRHIFGFCEDYEKIIYGRKQTLTLVRKSDN
ncbi:hypothetical protein CAPTEDRAFT_64066, partial [Capitella teleta]